MTKAELSASVTRTQRRKKQKAIERFGGKCVICGYNKCLAALEFHHISNKLHSPAYVIGRWSWDRAKKELDKCIVLCANCHREAEYGVLPPEECRNKVLPFVEKTCPVCHNLFDTKVEEQVFCGQTCAKFSSRKVKHPTKEELQALLDQDLPMTQLGRMFSVSDNTVRAWASKLGCKL